MNKPFVAILMGSDSLLPAVRPTFEVLKRLGIHTEVKITSAHRTPVQTHAYVKDASERGCAVFICAASKAAHLAGTVAGLTLRPVIGLPMDEGPLQGMDALLSTVQMPPGVPVATVSLGKDGARNAAYLAAQMLALADPEIAARLRKDRTANAAAIVAKDRQLQDELEQGG